MKKNNSDAQAFLQKLADNVSPATCIEDARDEAEKYYKKSLSAKKIADKFSVPFVAGVTTLSTGALCLAGGLLSIPYSEQATEIGVISGISAIGLGLLATIPYKIAKKSNEKNALKCLESEISALKREQLEADYEASSPYNPCNLQFASTYNAILSEKQQRSFSAAFDEISAQKQANLDLINQVARDSASTDDFEPIN